MAAMHDIPRNADPIYSKFAIGTADKVTDARLLLAGVQSLLSNHDNIDHDGLRHALNIVCVVAEQLDAIGLTLSNSEFDFVTKAHAPA